MSVRVRSRAYCFHSFPTEAGQHELQSTIEVAMRRHAMRASGPLTPLTLDDARRLIYLDHYNTVRLRGAIDYVTPQDRLAGRQAEPRGSRSQVGTGSRAPTSRAADDVFEVCAVLRHSYNDFAG